jgi:uncharacterized membrane protein YebE (DUF533 family)
MALLRGIFRLVKVLLGVVVAAGLLAALGAVAYAVVNRNSSGAPTSYDQFPDVPVNPKADQAA